jgi:histidinol-phosphate aminotransferase
MKKLVPDYIEQLPLYPPGKPVDEVKREFGIDAIIKLASNENSLGPSPKALQALQAALADLHRYPDNGCYYLREKLAQRCGIEQSQVLFGHGSNEIIQLIALAFLTPAEEVITSEQTFILYPIMSNARGARVIEVPLKDFTYDLEAMAGRITNKTKIIFISNPNNPTGTMVDADALRTFMQRVPGDVLVVLDEAYGEYVASPAYPDSLEYLRQGRNIIILRTFSKIHGLAGLRIGYALCPAQLVNYLERVRVPFNVNHMAQVAALAALDDREHIERSQDNNQAGLIYIYAELKSMGLACIPTHTNFLLVNLGTKAENVYQKLLREGVIIRSMASYGLDNYVRVTIGLPEENERFIRSLKKVLQAINKT